MFQNNIKMFTVFKKIKNIIPTYHKHGLDGLFYSMLRNLGFKCRYHNFIDKRLHNLTKEIEKISNNVVMWGPYKGTKLLDSSNANHWFVDTPNRLIGLYEYEVQKKLIELTKNDQFEYFINFGAADGYHLISILKQGFVKKGLAFEMNPDGRKFLQKTADVNSVSDKIEIYEKADLTYIKDKFSEEMLIKTIFLIDIETDEFDLLDDDALKFLSKSVLLIENHDFMYKNKEKVNNYFSNIKKYFNLEYLKYASRDPNIIPELNNFREMDRWIMMDEGRPSTMTWLILTPKNT